LRPCCRACPLFGACFKVWRLAHWWRLGGRLADRDGWGWGWGWGWDAAEATGTAGSCVSAALDWREALPTADGALVSTAASLTCTVLAPGGCLVCCAAAAASA